MNNSLTQYFEYFNNYEKLVSQATSYIQDIINKNNYQKPEFGITLGSGLGSLADKITNPIKIPYKDIPNFPTTTIKGHEGVLIIGQLSGVTVIGLKGRKHFYEVAHEPFNNGILKTVFAVHLLANLGIKNYFVTNAAGGLNPNYKLGDMMIIKSHINFLPNVLLGTNRSFKRLNDDSPVWRFQPMNEAYDNKYSQLLHEAKKEYQENIHFGTYLAVTGPTFETQAESIAFRDGLKADAVGMSTTPEVIAAKSRNMKVVGFSCITNVIAKNGTNATNHEEVQAILNSKEIKNRLSETVLEFFNKYNKRV